MGWLACTNIPLAVFNLIPGFPLDGGRILRAILWGRSGDADRATMTAARVGQAVAFGFIVRGVMQFFGGAGFGGRLIGRFCSRRLRPAAPRWRSSPTCAAVHVGDIMATVTVPQAAAAPVP